MKNKEKAVKAKKEKGTPFYKKQGFKYSWLSTVLIALFIACVVGANILASFVASRTSFNIDLTSSNNYSISDDNAGFIKKVDKEVSIIVTTTEDYYKGTYYSDLAQNNISDPSGGKYFNQTVEILKNYAKLNPKISLKFIDAQTPAFDPYLEKFSSDQISYGDIIIDCVSKNSEGKTQERHKVLSLNDLYTVEDKTGGAASGYGTYTITGSSVESAVTSAIMFASAEQTDNVTVVTGYGCSKVENLQSLLKSNNYVFNEIEKLSTTDIPESTDILVLAAPTLDLTPAEVKKIDDFLLGGKLGKNLVYFAASSQVKLPNLEAALKEWGIEFGEGTVYETDTNYYSSNSNTNMFLADAGSDYTTSINKNLEYYSGKIRPMKTTFSQLGKYHTYELVKSSTGTVTMPKGAADNWEPAKNATKGSYASVVLSTYAMGDPNDEQQKTTLSSNVLSVAAVDFVDGEYMNYSAVANDDLMVEMFNKMVKRDDDVYKFTDKVIDVSAFTPNAVQKNIIVYTCAVGLPLIVLAAGITVFVRRKSR